MVATPVQAGRRKARAMPSGVAGLVVFALFAAVVFFVGHFAYGVYEASRPVTFPVTLDSLDIANDTTTLSIGDTVRTTLATQNPSVDVQVRVYGGATFNRVITVAVTIGPRTVNDLGAFGKGTGLGPVHAVGSSQCASSGTQHATVCLRSDGNRAVVVSYTARDATPVEADVAAMVDQVWQPA
jgi:hypothetical protein